MFTDLPPERIDPPDPCENCGLEGGRPVRCADCGAEMCTECAEPDEAALCGRCLKKVGVDDDGQA